jgi:hypothetical protein
MMTSLDSGSKVNVLRAFAEQRAYAQIRVSDAGKESNSSEVHPENMLASILSRFDPDSKVTEAKLEQLKK